MKKIMRFTFFSLLIILFLNACDSNNDENNSTNEDIFQNKGTVIGDNSAVTSIIGQLKHKKEFQKVSLETKSKPYGINLKYKNIEATLIEKEYKETAIYNATFLFALIDNAEWTTFNFGDQKYKITKAELQDWYSEKLNGFTNEEELKTLIQEQLKDENKVNQLFAK